MKDKEESKKRLIAECDTTQDKANEFEEQFLYRETLVNLLSLVDEILRPGGATLRSGFWIWDMVSGYVAFRLRPAYDKGLEHEERSMKATWEGIVAPANLEKVATWLKSVIKGGEPSTATCSTRDARILKLFSPEIKSSDERRQVTVVGFCIEFTPSRKKLADSTQIENEEDRAEAALRYHFDDIISNAESLAEIVGPFIEAEEISGKLIKGHEKLHRIEKELLGFQSKALEVAGIVVAHSNGAVFLKNKDRRFVSVTRSMTDLLGCSESEILGKTDRELPEVSKWQIENSPGFETCPDYFCHLVRRDTKCAVNVLALITLPLLGDVPRRYLGFALPWDEPRHDLQGKYKSKRMMECEKKARQVSKTDRIILLTGESGSGKDHLAKYIHDHSPRAQGPFYSINCAAVPVEVAESELFGHEKGGFTGATTRKRGLLELAEGGTLVLNEIGELSPPIQAKLLQFLDTKRFTRIGGEKEISVNARLIAATNRNLERNVEEGKFRNDLFYRINVIQIEVPPLRERLEDLKPLVADLLERIKVEEQLPYTPFMDDTSLATIARKPPEGNIRELYNILVRAIVLHGGPHVKIGSSPKAPLAVKNTRAAQINKEKENPNWTWSISFPIERKLEDLVKDMKRALFVEALQRCEGNITKAARLLGMRREVLSRRIRKMGIDCDQ